MMRKLNDSQLQNLEAGKFWGWSCGPAYGLESGSCFRNCEYRVLGIVTQTLYTQPCSNLPGSNPTLEP
jgi:hypothetical protein